MHVRGMSGTPWVLPGVKGCGSFVLVSEGENVLCVQVVVLHLVCYEGKGVCFPARGNCSL